MNNRRRVSIIIFAIIFTLIIIFIIILAKYTSTQNESNVSVISDQTNETEAPSSLSNDATKYTSTQNESNVSVISDQTSETEAPSSLSNDATNEPVVNQSEMEPEDVIISFVEAARVGDVEAALNLIASTQKPYFTNRTIEEQAEVLKGFYETIYNPDYLKIFIDHVEGDRGLWIMDYSTTASPDFFQFVTLIKEETSWKILSMINEPGLLGPEPTAISTPSNNSTDNSENESPPPTINQKIMEDELPGLWATEKDENGNQYTIILSASLKSYMSFFVSDSGHSETKSYGFYEFIVEDGITKLNVTTSEGEIIKFVFERSDDLTLIMYLADEESVKFIRIIEDKDGSEGIEDLPNQPETPESINITIDDFLQLVKNNDINRVTSLIEEGFDVNAQDKDGITSLMVASINNDYQMIELLINKGARIEIKDNSGATALSYAALEGSKSAAEKLLEKGADVNAQEASKGDTPIMIAIKNKRIELVKLLYNNDAELQVKNNEEATAVDLAFATGNSEIYSALNIDEVDDTSISELQSYPDGLFDPDFEAIENMYTELVGKWKGMNELGEVIIFEFKEDRTFILKSLTKQVSINGLYYIKHYDVSSMWVGTKDEMFEEVPRLKIIDNDKLWMTDRFGYTKKLTRMK